MSALRPRLLLAEPAGFTPEVLATLRQWAEVELGPVPDGGIGTALRDHDIVWIRLGHRVRATDVAGPIRCRILAVPATGLDHLDEEACTQAGVQIAALRGEVEFLRGVRAKPNTPSGWRSRSCAEFRQHTHRWWPDAGTARRFAGASSTGGWPVSSEWDAWVQSWPNTSVRSA